MPTERLSVYKRGSAKKDESAPNQLPPAVDPIRTLAHPSAAGTPAAAPCPTSTRASYPPCISPRLGARTVNPVWTVAHPSAAGTPSADPLAARTWLPPSILPRRRRSGRIDQGCAGQHRGNQESGEFAHDILLWCPHPPGPLCHAHASAGTPEGVAGRAEPPIGSSRQYRPGRVEERLPRSAGQDGHGCRRRVRAARSSVR